MTPIRTPRALHRTSAVGVAVRTVPLPSFLPSAALVGTGPQDAARRGGDRFPQMSGARMRRRAGVPAAAAAAAAALLLPLLLLLATPAGVQADSFPPFFTHYMDPPALGDPPYATATAGGDNITVHVGLYDANGDIATDTLRTTAIDLMTAQAVGLVTRTSASIAFIADTASGYVKATLNLTVADDYVIMVTYNAVAIKTYLLTVAPAAASAAHCALEGPGLAFGVAGLNATFAIVSKDAHGNLRPSHYADPFQASPRAVDLPLYYFLPVS